MDQWTQTSCPSRSRCSSAHTGSTRDFERFSSSRVPNASHVKVSPGTVDGLTPNGVQQVLVRRNVLVFPDFTPRHGQPIPNGQLYPNSRHRENLSSVSGYTYPQTQGLENLSSVSRYTYPQTRLKSVKHQRPVVNAQAPLLVRTKTSVAPPSRHCDACAVEYVRQWLKYSHYTDGFPYVEAPQPKPPMEQAVLYNTLVSPESLPDSNMTFPPSRQKSKIFMLAGQHREGTSLNKEEIYVPTASVPKKGLLKLTSLEYEHRNPQYFEKPKEELPARAVHGVSSATGGRGAAPATRGVASGSRNTLIKRKDILRQIQLGGQQLEQEARLTQMREDMEKQMSECTFGDLTQKLLHYKPATVPRHPPSAPVLPSAPEPTPQHVFSSSADAVKMRSLTLPAIHPTQPSS